jgi:hypothetical protein
VRGEWRYSSNILNLGPSLFTTGKITAGTHFCSRLGGPLIPSDSCGGKKNLLLLLGIELRSVGRPCRIQLTMLTPRYPGSFSSRQRFHLQVYCLRLNCYEFWGCHSCSYVKLRRLLFSVLWHVVTNVSEAPAASIFRIEQSTLNMEAAGLCKMLVTMHESTRRHIVEASTLNFYRRENFRHNLISVTQICI